MKTNLIILCQVQYGHVSQSTATSRFDLYSLSGKFGPQFDFDELCQLVRKHANKQEGQEEKVEQSGMNSLKPIHFFDKSSVGLSFLYLLVGAAPGFIQASKADKMKGVRI